MPPRPPRPPRSHEILFEFRRIGNVVKVSAIDTGTNVEVSIIGPAHASPRDLKRAALSRLIYVLKRDNPGIIR